jgi:DNA mismatch repair protein MutS2
LKKLFRRQTPFVKFFPPSALVQLEYDKVKSLLEAYCETFTGKERALQLRIHTKKEFIEKELRQTNEYKLLLSQYCQRIETAFHSGGGA